MRTQALSEELLVGIQSAAAANADDLLSEAKLLLQAGRHARAHALAALAFEEFGKHVMTVSALLRRDEPNFWKRYRRRFHDHHDKLRQARVAVEVFSGLEDWDDPDFLGRIFAWAESENVRKMLGLYVDVGDDGLLRTPSQSVTAEEAERLIEDVELLMKVGRVVSARLAPALERRRSGQTAQGSPAERRRSALDWIARMLHETELK